jgi:small-conductance mechanosensitive channel
MKVQERKAQVAELKKDEDVQVALKQASHTEPEIEPEGKKQSSTFKLILYALLLVGGAVLFYLLRLGVFSFAGIVFTEKIEPILERAAAGLIAVMFVGIVSQLVKMFFIAPLTSSVARFNLRRIVNLVGGLLIFFIVITILFADWYTAVVSLGLISLILGFALQTPITSFIGWIYILVRAPYQVGDRIKMGDAQGDVIDVSYLDTTLWEFGGDYLSTDHPSGRIIKFPNSKVLSSAVTNYSWSLFPYIWTEIKFSVGYQSDLEYVAKVMRETAAEEVGEEMMERVRIYRELLSQTPVDPYDVKEYPSVVFRVNSNTWLDAIVRYLVKPKSAGTVKNRLMQKMLKKLNEEPERVLLPKGDAR